MPNTPHEKEPVDRSRLKLLGVLAAAGASGACVSSTPGPNPYDAARLSTDKPAGGEGGGGGGSAH